MSYGVLGEDNSDAQTLKVLIQRLKNDRKLTVKTKGFGGCGEMLSKGAAHLAALRDLGLQRFVVCYDADGPDPTKKLHEIVTRIIKPSGFAQSCCAVIPVQELEAWILADVTAVEKMFAYWRPRAITNPEQIANPKEYLARLSRAENRKPVYSHAMHNPRVAEYLDLAVVERKCPSFQPLVSFVRREAISGAL